MKHLLTLAQLAAGEIAGILALAKELKAQRTGARASCPSFDAATETGTGGTPALLGQTWALIFTKASTRTRVSFEVGIRELGGNALYLSGNDIQMGRGESVADTARVLSRYVHGAVIRTYAQKDVDEFAQYGSIPVINALTDDDHPCQILADLLTIEEKLGSLKGKKVVFIGDGACNVPASWIAAAPKTGIDLWIAAPKAFQPAPAAGIQVTEDLFAAAKNADVLYTDVWVSMGKEAEAAERVKVLAGYQINDRLLQVAKPGALVMHCLPAYRGKEITGEVFEAHQQTIFDQAENRLHVQKAIMTMLARR